MMSDKPLLLGIFPSRELAAGAIDELGHSGYTRDHIGILTPDEKIEQAQIPALTQEDAAATGAETGALAGGGFGILAGAIAVIAFPGIGAVVTGGILSVLAGAAAAGAAFGAFTGPFVAMGMTEEDARHYANELKAGRTIVAVQVDSPEQQDEVVTVLRSHGASAVTTRNGLVLAPRELVKG
jgi:hypothetical protein